MEMNEIAGFSILEILFIQDFFFFGASYRMRVKCGKLWHAYRKNIPFLGWRGTTGSRVDAEEGLGSESWWDKKTKIEKRRGVYNTL